MAIPSLISELKSLSNCRKKVKYKTLIDAELDIARIWFTSKRNLVLYECKWCYGFHLTHGKWKDKYKGD